MQTPLAGQDLLHSRAVAKPPGQPEGQRRLTELAECLELLFSGRRTQRLVLLGRDESGKKKSRTVQGEATRKHYMDHLDQQAVRGPNGLGFGGLGLFAGVSDRPASQGKAIWMTSWIALDLDAITPEQAEPLLDDLRSRNLHVYISRGTTGRGCHIWIFVEGQIPQVTAARAVKKLASLAAHRGFPTVECFPLNPCGAGNGIHLPYRGAVLDGFGFNPLLEADGLAPVSLLHAASIRRNDPEDIEALLLEQRPVMKVRRVSRQFTGDPEPVWYAELERVRRVWQEGVRTSLSLGVAAFGLFIGIAPEQVLADLDRLMVDARDEERKWHLGAVHDTISRWQCFQDGSSTERTAFKTFYERAGIEPPFGAGVDEKARAFLKRLNLNVPHLAWPGRGGETDLSIYRTLLELAGCHGRSTAAFDGVEVSVSVRQLAERVRLSVSSVHASLQRLTIAERVSRASKGQGEDSGVLVLMEVKPNIQSTLVCAEALLTLTRERALPPNPDLQNTVLHASLGLPGRTKFVIFSLEREPNLTCTQISKRIQRDSRDTRKTLIALVELGVLQRTNRSYALVPNVVERLNAIADESGANVRAEQLKARHVQDRETRRLALTKPRLAKQPAQELPEQAVQLLEQPVLNLPAVTQFNPLSRPSFDTPEQITLAREWLLTGASDPTRCAGILSYLKDAERLRVICEVLGEEPVLDAATIAARTKDMLSKPRPSKRHLRPLFPPEVRTKERAPSALLPRERMVPEVHAAIVQPEVLNPDQTDPNDLKGNKKAAIAGG